MSLSRDPVPAGPPDEARLDKLLDDALEETFPASDPVAIRFDQPSPTVEDEDEQAGP